MHLSLEITGTDPLQGNMAWDGGRCEFTGWLAFTRQLESIVEQSDQPEAVPEPSD